MMIKFDRASESSFKKRMSQSLFLILERVIQDVLSGLCYTIVLDKEEDKFDRTIF